MALTSKKWLRDQRISAPDDLAQNEIQCSDLTITNTVGRGTTTTWKGAVNPVLISDGYN